MQPFPNRDAGGRRENRSNRRRSRGSKLSNEVELLLNKLVQQVRKNFKNLPKSLNWSSFYENILLVLMDIYRDVQKTSIYLSLAFN